MKYSEVLDMQLDLFNFWSHNWDTLQEFYQAVFEDNDKQFNREENEIMLGITLPPLLLAQPYYWSSPITELVYKSSLSLPKQIILTPDLLPCPHGFFWFETPILLTKDSHPLCAILWSTKRITQRTEKYTRGTLIKSNEVLQPDDVMSVCLFKGSEDIKLPVPVPLGHLACNIGYELTEFEAYLSSNVDEDSSVIPAFQFLLSSFLFLSQKIIMPQYTMANRATQHRIKKSEPRLSKPIAVIALRRREYTKQGELRHVDWQWQWLVSGHWRNQWYPSSKTYRPRWITPYMKGPSSKPFKEPKQSIFAVVR